MKKLIIVLLLLSCNKSVKDLIPKNKIDNFFWEIIKNDKVHELKDFLSLEENKELDLNIENNENGETPLTFAVKSNSLKVVEFLLNEKKINLEGKNRRGQTPLMVSILDSSKCLERDLIIKKLLNNGADVNIRYGTRCNTLMLTIIEGDTNTVKEILNKDIDINAQNSFGETALILAIKSNIDQEKRKEIIELLLNKENINLNKRDKYKKSALCYSLPQDNFSDMLSKMLRKKVNFIFSLKDQNLDYFEKILSALDLKLVSNYNLKCLLKEDYYLSFFNKIKNLEAHSRFKILDFIFYKINEGNDITYKNKLLELGRKDVDGKTIFNYLKECEYEKVTSQKVFDILKYQHNIDDLIVNVFLSNENKVKEYINNLPNCTDDFYYQNLIKIIHINTEEMALKKINELAKKKEFNFQSEKHDTFLHYAVRNGCLELTKKILEIHPELSLIKGKETNLIPVFEVLGLSYPKNKKIVMLERFLELEFLKNEIYSSFLFTAVVCKEVEVVKRLLKLSRINNGYKNVQNQNCLSNLLFHELLLKEKGIKEFSFFYKRIKDYSSIQVKKEKFFYLVEILIKNNINIEEKDCFGRAPLDYILLLTDLFEYLKEKKVLNRDMNREKIKFLDESKIREAIETDNIDLIKQEEINNITLSGHNIIHYVVNFGSNKDFLKKILNKSNRKNLNALDYYWQTPLTLLITEASAINKEITSLFNNYYLIINYFYNNGILNESNIKDEMSNRLNLLNQKLKMALLLFENGGQIHIHEEIIKGDMVPSLNNLMNIYYVMKEIKKVNLFSIDSTIGNINLLNILMRNLINDKTTLICLPAANYNTMLDLAIIYENKEIVDCIIENKNKYFYISKDFHKLSESQKQNIIANIENRGLIFDNREKKDIEFTFFEAAIRGYYAVLERIVEEVPGNIKYETLEEILHIIKRKKLEFTLEITVVWRIEEIIIHELKKRGLK